MLVLSRKKNEGIVFDGPGRVIVVGIRGDKVRLGFETDSSVTVHRDEVALAIERQKVEEVRQRIGNGEPIHKIRDDLDARENVT